jgi:type II secretory ATPase GspE/PulE/Tfp pilus assembly ATPase PilB-like protein
MNPQECLEQAHGRIDGVLRSLDERGKPLARNLIKAFLEDAQLDIATASHLLSQNGQVPK